MKQRKLVLFVMMVSMIANVWVLSTLARSRFIGDVALSTKDDTVIGMIGLAVSLVLIVACFLYLIWINLPGPE